LGSYHPTEGGGGSTQLLIEEDGEKRKIFKCPAISVEGKKKNKVLKGEKAPSQYVWQHWEKKTWRLDLGQGKLRGEEALQNTWFIWMNSRKREGPDFKPRRGKAKRRGACGVAFAEYMLKFTKGGEKSFHFLRGNGEKSKNQKRGAADLTIGKHSRHLYKPPKGEFPIWVFLLEEKKVLFWSANFGKRLDKKGGCLIQRGQSCGGRK